MTEITQQEIAAVPYGQPQYRTSRLGHRARRVAIYAALAIGGFIFAVPFLWLLSSSLKEPTKIWLFPPQ